MKQALTNTFLLATFVVLSACNKGGDGGGGAGGGGQQVALVPGPQSRILGNDQATYCDFNNGTVLCGNLTGGTCGSQLTYKDIATLCSQLTQVQNFSRSGPHCQNISTITQQVSTQYCAGVLPTSQLGYPQTLTAGAKTVQCEISGYRGNYNLGSASGSFPIGGQYPSSVNLLGGGNGFSKFINKLSGLSKFGSVNLSYSSAGFGARADMLTLSSKGFDGPLVVTQSGFGGDRVGINVSNDDGSISLNVSCTGTSGNFRKNTALTNIFTQYVCVGSSNLYEIESFKSRKEEVRISIPYSSLMVNGMITLANHLTAAVTGVGTASAAITFQSYGVAAPDNRFDNLTMVETTANLNATTTLLATDGLAKVSLTCGPQ